MNKILKKLLVQLGKTKGDYSIKDFVNKFGNIPQTDNPELVWISTRKDILNKLGIEYAQCFVGFSKSGRQYFPQYNGKYILKTDLCKLAIKER